MGKALADAFPSARAVFDEVDDALGQKLSVIMWEGPKETLTLTENAQPALMAVSMAVMRVLETEKGFALPGNVTFVAGHSLGEYSALAAAGAFSLADTARLLRIRGQAMQKAVPVGVGAMAALLGVGIDVAAKVAAEAAQGDVCQVANDNEPTQVVLSGHKSAIDRVADIGKKYGVRRAVPLPVSAPFHCALMQPAADRLASELAQVEVKSPAVPVVSNVEATPNQDAARVKDLLARQVTAPVRWEESVQCLAGLGVNAVVEVGAGNVLGGLVRRIAPDIAVHAAGDPASIEALAHA